MVGEQVHFSLSIDSYFFFYCENLILESNLMYYPTEKFGGISDSKNTLFKKVSTNYQQITNIYKGNSLMQGINEYIEIQFDNMHFCVFTGSLHTILLNF